MQADYENIVNTKKMVVRHIRTEDKERPIKGTMVAALHPEQKTFSVGVSECCSKDRFDKKFGTNLAFIRSQFNGANNKKRTFHVHDDIKEEVQDFVKHAKKYFKDKEYIHSLDIEE